MRLDAREFLQDKNLYCNTFIVGLTMYCKVETSISKIQSSLDLSEIKRSKHEGPNNTPDQ